jgi:hypothetical protein
MLPNAIRVGGFAALGRLTEVTMNVRALAPAIALVVTLVTAGCTTTYPVLMVHPSSGKQLQCPPQPGEKREFQVETNEQAARLGRLVAESQIRPMTPQEFCIRQLEILGYVRAPTEALPPLDIAVSVRSYTSPVYRWSISYPANWTIDSKDPSFVRIHSAADNALCGIHSGPVRFETLDEFTDFMLAHNERFIRGRGQAFVILARRRISLQNEIIGNDVLVEIGPGGKSRRILVLVDGRGFAIDCETYATNWEKLDPFFERVINSFTFGK